MELKNSIKDKSNHELEYNYLQNKILVEGTSEILFKHQCSYELQKIRERQELKLLKLSEKQCLRETEEHHFSMSSENGSAISNLEQKIIRQIEYYFGDFNIPRDKFLSDEVKKDDGWVTIETMTKFNRLASLSKDHTVLIEALKKSTNDLMEINEDGTKIRRSPKHPAPKSMKEVFQNYEDKTLFVKGFSPDANLDDIEDFFLKAGTIVNIVMRKRHLAKEFKGSVFVAFKDKEASDNFLTSDEFKAFNGNELIRKHRSEYVKEKATSREEAKAKAAELRADADGKRDDLNRARLRSRMTLGALLELSSIPTDVPEQKLVVEMKTMMKECGAPDVAYVETDNLKNGKVIVRFKDENTAAEALEKLLARENGLKFVLDIIQEVTESTEEEGDKAEEKEEAEEKEKESGSGKMEKKTFESDLAGRVLVGEEEEKAWVQILEERQQRLMKRKAGGRRGGGRDGEPSSKRGRFQRRK